MEEGKVLDGMSAKTAWQLCWGVDREFPPPISAPTAEFGYSDLDYVVAKYFGPVTEESLNAAYTAIRAIHPRLVECRMRQSGLQGKKLRTHVAKTTVKAMRDYRLAADMSLRGIADDVRAIRRWDLRAVSNWFYVWDSLGSTGANVVDGDVYEFYEFAGLQWRYLGW